MTENVSSVNLKLPKSYALALAWSTTEEKYQSLFDGLNTDETDTATIEIKKGQANLFLEAIYNAQNNEYIKEKLKENPELVKKAINELMALQDIEDMCNSIDPVDNALLYSPIDISEIQALITQSGVTLGEDAKIKIDGNNITTTDDKGNTVKVVKNADKTTSVTVTDKEGKAITDKVFDDNGKLKTDKIKEAEDAKKAKKAEADAKALITKLGVTLGKDAKININDKVITTTDDKGNTVKVVKNADKTTSVTVTDKEGKAITDKVFDDNGKLKTDNIQVAKEQAAKAKAEAEAKELITKSGVKLPDSAKIEIKDNVRTTKDNQGNTVKVVINDDKTKSLTVTDKAGKVTTDKKFGADGNLIIDNIKAAKEQAAKELTPAERNLAELKERFETLVNDTSLEGSEKAAKLSELQGQIDLAEAAVEREKAEQAQTSTIGALYQNLGKLKKKQQAAFVSNIEIISQLTGKNDIYNFSISDIQNEIEKTQKAITEYQAKYGDETEEEASPEQEKMNDNNEKLKKSYEKLKQLLEKHSGLAKNVTVTTPEQKKEGWWETTKELAGDAWELKRKAGEFVEEYTGLNALDRADTRSYEIGKNSGLLRGTAQAIGEFAAQPAAFAARAGEIVNIGLEKPTDAIDNMEEGAVKEVAQSVAGSVKTGSGALNVITGLGNLMSYYLKFGDNSNKILGEIVEKTATEIAAKMVNESEENINELKYLYDIRLILGKPKEELEQMGEEKVKELLDEKIKSKEIPVKQMLVAYGQITGEVLVDDMGELYIKDGIEGRAQLIKGLYQIDQGIADTFNLPSASLGGLNKLAEKADEALKVKEDDSALTAGAKYSGQVVTKTGETLTGIGAGIGDIASGILKSTYAWIPGTETKYKDIGKQIGKGIMNTGSGGWWSRLTESGKKTDEALAAAEAEQTKGRQKIAKENNYEAKAEEGLKATKAKWQKTVDTTTESAGDKLLTDMMPGKDLKEKQANLQKVLDQPFKDIMLPQMITKAKANLEAHEKELKEIQTKRKLDRKKLLYANEQILKGKLQVALTEHYQNPAKTKKAEITSLITDINTNLQEQLLSATTKLSQEPNNAKLKAAVAKLQTECEKYKTANADKLIEQQNKAFEKSKTEYKKKIKENMKKGITALLRAYMNKADAERLVDLAKNDAQFKDSPIAKAFFNKLEFNYSQNEFGKDKNGFLKFLESFGFDGIVLQAPRMLLAQPVSTMDKALAWMTCLNFIGSIVEMGAGARKVGDGIDKMMNAKGNPALAAAGQGILGAGTAEILLSVGLSYINCCSHLILGEHENPDWLWHDVCCDDEHVVNFIPIKKKAEPAVKPIIEVVEAWIDKPWL